MKVLVDTCVWSLALRRCDAQKLNSDEQGMLKRLKEAIRDRRATIIGPVRQEILSGIRDPKQFATTHEILDPFLDEAILAGDYIEAARLYNRCRSQGIQSGPTDMLLCTVALRLQYGILTLDQGLLRCMDVLTVSGTDFSPR